MQTCSAIAAIWPRQDSQRVLQSGILAGQAIEIAAAHIRVQPLICLCMCSVHAQDYS